jgi:flagellin
MIGGLSTLNSQLSTIYNSNNNALAEIYGKIASGKKIQGASDNFTGYARAKSLQNTIDGYSTVKQDLTEAKGAAETAVSLGNGIYDDLVRMKQLATLYTDIVHVATADEKTAYNAEFETLGASIMDTVNNNKYNGIKVVSVATLATVYVNPDNTTDTLAIAFAAGDIISDVAGVTWNLDGVGGGPTSAAAVQTEINTMTSYLIKAEKYVDKIDKQITITDDLVLSKQATQSLIMDVDDAAETAKATELEVRQQATVAMIAQANLSHSNIARLYGGN